MAKTGSFLSTFTTHFTTFLPSNNHVLHTTFSKTPLKNKGKDEHFTLGTKPIFFLTKSTSIRPLRFRGAGLSVGGGPSRGGRSRGRSWGRRRLLFLPGS